MKKQMMAVAVLTTLGAMFSTSAMAQATDTIAKAKAAGKVVMGVRGSSAPLSSTVGEGKFVGYHVELCEQILKKVLPGVKVEYQEVTSANRIPLVQNGTVDIECGSTTNNTARQQQVAFAVTTYITEVRMAVRANSNITSIAQLDGKKVATTQGTTSVQTLRKNEKAKSLNFEEVYGKDHADSFLLLESGRADAFVMDDNILASNIANSKKPSDFKIAGEVLSVEPIAIMFRKDDPAFKTAVDNEIKAMMKSGDLNKLYAKWFTSPIPPKNMNLNLPMGDTLKAAFAAPNDKPMEAYAAK